MKTRFAAVLAAALCSLVGCEDKNTPAGAGKTGSSTFDAAKDAAKGAIDKVGEATAAAKDKVVSAANDQIDKVSVYITKLKDKASTIAAEQKPEFDKAMASIDANMTKLKAKITELKNAGVKEWDKLGADVADGAAKLYGEAKAAVDKYVK